jgi:hypothetical protein
MHQQYDLDELLPWEIGEARELHRLGMSLAGISAWIGCSAQAVADLFWKPKQIRPDKGPTRKSSVALTQPSPEMLRRSGRPSGLDHDLVWQLHEEGLNQRQIAERLGTSQPRVSQVLKSMKETR